MPQVLTKMLTANFSEVATLASARQATHGNFDVQQQRSNFLKLHCIASKKLHVQSRLKEFSVSVSVQHN